LADCLRLCDSFGQSFDHAGTLAFVLNAAGAFRCDWTATATVHPAPSRLVWLAKTRGVPKRCAQAADSDQDKTTIADL